MGRYENTSETPAAMPRSSVTSPCTRGNSFGLPFEPERRQKVLCNADVKSSGCEGEERQSVGDSDRARPDLYKKEAEIFMDVSVLIGKPLGALRPSPPITAREEVNTRARTHTHTDADERRWSESQSAAPVQRPCHPQPGRQPFIRLIRLHRRSNIVTIITRAVIVTILSGTYGREQPLRALSQTQPNWLGLISEHWHARARLGSPRGPQLLSPADGDEETDTL